MKIAILTAVVIALALVSLIYIMQTKGSSFCVGCQDGFTIRPDMAFLDTRVHPAAFSPVYMYNSFVNELGLQNSLYNS